jgi:hypothetical protein
MVSGAAPMIRAALATAAELACLALFIAAVALWAS